MIKVRCDCGRLLKLKDSAAGRRLRCPDCGDPVDVPDPNEVYEADAYEDDYGDSYEDDYEDDYQSAPPRRKPAGGRSRRKSSGPNPTVIIAAGAAVALLLLIGIGAAFWMGGNDGPLPEPIDVARNAAANAPGAPPVPAQPGLPAVTPTAAVTPAPVPATPVAAAENPNGDFWVVLSNLKSTSSPGAFGKTISVDYRIAQGTTDPTKRYILFVGQSSAGGMMERYIEYDEFTISRSGTIEFNTSPTFSIGSGQLRAFMGYRTGHQKWEKVSGDAGVGKTTEATPPPSILELAGDDAEGKLFAVANATIKNGPGPTSFSVDLVLQGSINPAQRYFLVAETPSGTGGFNVEISRDIRNTPQGEKKTIAGRLLGVGRPGSSGEGMTLHVEKRGLSRLRSDDTEIVSNRTLVK